jgi:hypothetical protein
MGKKLKAAVQEQAHDDRVTLSGMVRETFEHYSSGKDLLSQAVPIEPVTESINFFADEEVMKAARVRAAKAGEKHNDIVRQALAYRARKYLS